jgi:hypothetical protein
MRIPTPLYALGAAAAIAALAGCSGGASAVNPIAGGSTGQTAQHVSPMSVSRIPSMMNPAKMALLHPSRVQPKGWMSKDVATGDSLLYASQFFTSDIQVYRQSGTGQSPVGTIVNGVINPQGMTVSSNGDLYVANTGANNILVFHKGRLNPYRTLADPNQFPVDVAVAADGTVYASNIFDTSAVAGSVSKYAPGANSPTATYAVPNNLKVLFDALNDDGTLYVNYIDLNSGLGAMVKFYPGSNSADLTGVTTGFPGGMQFDNTHDLLGLDQLGPFAGIYELPSGTPSFEFASDNGDPLGVALVRNERQVYVSDAAFGVVHQYSYPGGVEDNTISTGLGSSSPPFGVAADAGAPL